MYDHVFNHDENNRAAHPFDEVPEEDYREQNWEKFVIKHWRDTQGENLRYYKDRKHLLRGLLTTC